MVQLVLFVAVAGFLFKGLALDPAELPSPLIDKMAPEFTVARLPRTANDPELGNFSSHDLDGQVWVLNVWASWCVPCVQEHPYLVSLAQQRAVPLVGLNYKDDPEIRDQILAGSNKQDIDGYLIARYGDFVLYSPPFSAKTAVLWIGPFVLLVIVLVSVLLMIRRQRKHAGQTQYSSANSDAVDKELLEKAKRLLRD